MKKKTFIAIAMFFVMIFLCGCEEKSVTTDSSMTSTTIASMEVGEDSTNFEETTSQVSTTGKSTKNTTIKRTETTTDSVVTTTETDVIVTTVAVIESTEVIVYTSEILEVPTMPTQTETLSYSTYYVQFGDCLSRIAEMYGIDMNYLAQYNNMSVDNSIIYPGDTLLIPSGYVMQDYIYEPIYTDSDNYSYNNQTTYSDGLVCYGAETKTSWTAGWNSFTNMEIASYVLTNQVAYIPPGGNFSWLRDVGPCTSSPYVEADGYSGGEVVSVYGGGICMTASALKVAAIRAGCIITETHPHSMPVTYNDRSNPDWALYESAVDASGCDLCFYNPSSTTGLTILVYTDRYAGTCTAELIPDT